MMIQPLNGIRVLDLSRLLPGGYASQMLADFGADVVKIEAPRSGDYSRAQPPFGPAGQGLTFLAVNRNKRSVTLNIKSEQGRQLFLRLVEQADVVLESFRPGVMKRLGLDYEQLKIVNPRLIYCAISGFGQDGPYSQQAGHDLNYAGYAGLLYYNRNEQGAPVLPATQIGDLAGGALPAVTGILAALLGRERSGEGCMIDVAMSEGVMALLPLLTTTYLNTRQVPLPGQSALDGGLPCYNIYETSDGQYITLAALEQKFWFAFCTHIGRLELLPFHSPVGVVERDEAIAQLRAIFKTKTRDQWVHELAEIDACVGPVYNIEEALHDEHVQARQMVITSGESEEVLRTVRSVPRFSTDEQEQRYAPPLVGEHTIEILREIGCSENEIEQLKTEEII